MQLLVTDVIQLHLRVGFGLTVNAKDLTARMLIGVESFQEAENIVANEPKTKQ